MFLFRPTGRLTGNMILVLLSLHLCIDLSAPVDIYGKKCVSKSDCTSRQNAFADLDSSYMDCIDGYCRCIPGIEVKYSSYYMTPSCDFTSISSKFITIDDRCNATSCPANEVCEIVKHNGTLTSANKKFCYCKEGFLRVGEDCKEAKYQSLFEICNGQGLTARACNLEELQRCSTGRCGCFDGYYANATSGKCEPMQDYMKKYNLTEYRVKPGEYCKDSSQCISGLKCSYLKCACPSPCKYNRTEEICDCGVVTKSTDNGGPIGVGIFLGIVIMIFWGFMIRRTVKKLAIKRAAGFDNMSGVPRDSPSRDTYTLSPISQDTAASGITSPPVGLSVPSPRLDGRESPDPNSTLLPAKPGIPADPSYSINPPQAAAYDINPPQASAYGINPPQASAPYPVAPPPYSETPNNVSDVTPNPNSPYPTSGTQLPYPASPSRDPTQNHDTSAPPPYNPSYP